MIIFCYILNIYHLSSSRIFRSASTAHSKCMIFVPYHFFLLLVEHIHFYCRLLKLRPQAMFLFKFLKLFNRNSVIHYYLFVTLFGVLKLFFLFQNIMSQFSYSSCLLSFGCTQLRFYINCNSILE